MPGRITTHALDLTNGKPAAGMGVKLYYMGYELDRPLSSQTLASTTLNGDGRTSEPLCLGLKAGIYELCFDVGHYFGPKGVSFLDLVPIRFRVDNTEQDYHVPILVSPGGYSTYRGS